ncbi:MAG: DUF2851 family protein [Bacteroidales bacterium]|nr:DUF2851 family protein [Bacteroidales bacterium]
MKEEFLHFVWRYRLYDSGKLQDSEGNLVEVISPGEYNRDAGPDFLNARIRIGDTVWAGNAEIHINASDWFRHGHHNDHAYNNVVIHVVASNDRQAVTASGRSVPSLVPAIAEGVYEKYSEYVNNPMIIACQNDLPGLDKYYLSHWLNYLSIERLQSKSETIGITLRETNNDWEESLYRLVARYYGARVNTDNFEMLAKSLPLKLLHKHADNRLQVEALLFGMAGMLTGELFRDAVSDDYFRELMREFRVLRSKYSLVPMHGWLWKFHRLRPAGFPTVRLSQLAGLICRSRRLFSEVLEATSTEMLHSLLDNPASDYWNEHYSFGKKSGRRSGHAGEGTIDILIINVIIPMLFVHGTLRGPVSLCDRAVDFLGEIRAESNRITREWSSIGVSAASASDSQALNHLLNEYCRKRRCLECRAGQKLISRGFIPGEEHRTLLEQESRF